jgi:hypothetical protein
MPYSHQGYQIGILLVHPTQICVFNEWRAPAGHLKPFFLLKLLFQNTKQERKVEASARTQKLVTESGV